MTHDQSTKEAFAWPLEFGNIGSFGGRKFAIDQKAPITSSIH
jgi:hypothetical protein